MPIVFDSPSVKTSRLKYNFEGFDIQPREDYSDLELPRYKSSDDEAPKILIVVDYVPREDLESRTLLSGHQGKLLTSIVSRVSERLYLGKPVRPSWLAVSYNAFRTIGKPRTFQENARKAFGKRIEFVIEKYKPDVVLMFGEQPARYFLSDELALSKDNFAHWLGVPIKKTIRGHKCKFVSTMSLNSITTGENSESMMIGYMGRNIANALAGRHLFSIDKKRVKEHKTVYIDTIKKFDKLMDALTEHKGPVAVDTETRNLNRIINQLLTVQFSMTKDIGYLIPYAHKDTPFLADELAHIKKRLRKFFEKNKNDYHIYTNAVFDLNQLRAQIGVRFFCNDLWDLQAAEYVIDENMKLLTNIVGDGFYSLGNLSVQYGTTAYLTAKFGKNDRASIYSADLNDYNVQRYCTLDTVIPMAIHEQQIALGKQLRRKTFDSLVRHQVSDMLHSFSVMEHNGNLVDVNYLYYLKTANSPIQEQIKKMAEDLYSTPAALELNEELLRKKGVPTQGFLGKVTTRVFSLTDATHKRLFFFKTLGLTPANFGKNATDDDGDLEKALKHGKVDKTFQKVNEGVKEVAMFTALSEAKKLASAYVDSFIKLLGTSEDFKNDRRIRPQYKYYDVVTGRTSAAKPNLQQIPSRGALGKHIKRLFIAPMGNLYIKVDYRVHEVRGWGLISFDKAIAAVFQAAKDLRDSFRKHPTKELGKRLKLEADVHVINASYFFGVPVEKVDKPLRNNVKGVIFGLIYQMALKTLAKSLGKTLEFTEELVGNFNKRFPRGMKWIENVKKFAREHLYVESPLGMQRHLWGYMLPEKLHHARRVYGDLDRKAVNSPVQGMCSQFMAVGSRSIERIWWEIMRSEKRDTSLRVCNSVHDALENISRYGNILENIGHVERGLTVEVRRLMKERYGFEFLVDLEIDFEIGASLSTTEAWDFSLEQLEELCYKGLVFQRDTLKYEVDVKKAMREIFTGDDWDRAPKWLKNQAKNIGWEYRGIKPVIERIEQQKKEAAEKKAKEAAEKAAKEAAEKEAAGKKSKKQKAEA